MVHGYGLYRENKLEHASTVELVGMAFERVLEEISEARRHLAGGDHLARSRSITKAWEILAELTRMADPQAGEIARNLIRLYDFAMRKLLEPNASRSDASLQEAARVIGTVKEGWDAVKRREPSPEIWEPAAAAGQHTGWSL